MSKNLSLGNTFIPKLSPVVIARSLSRLSSDSLANLCLLWNQHPHTQPQPTKQQQIDLEITQQQLIKEMNQFIVKFKKNKKNKVKRKLIDKILVDFYKNGLNLLQFAQLDSQLLIEQPLLLSWTSSKLIDSNNQEQIINLTDPQLFLNNLLAELSKFFVNHLYISNHPYYPLIILRIQLFDFINDQLNISQLPQLNITNSIISRKPFFIALPINSSNIIHSYYNENDSSTKIILQCFETAISQTLNNKQLRILTSLNDPPIKSLESLHILKGNSRFSQSLGPWLPYANGTIDISPFDDVSKHSTLQKYKQEVEMIDADSKRQRIAMLRFKGSLDYELDESKLFEDNQINRRKRKLRIDEEEEEGEESDQEDIPSTKKNKYSTITPVQSIQLKLKNEYKTFKPTITLKIQGNDIFAGLHEFCDLDLMDPETMPNWLTGEDVSKSFNGIIEDDVFKPNNDSLIRDSNIYGSQLI